MDWVGMAGFFQAAVAAVFLPWTDWRQVIQLHVMEEGEGKQKGKKDDLTLK